MNLLVLLYYPFMEGDMAGGAQTTARILIDGLIRRGVFCRILCPAAPEGELVRACEGLDIRPDLREVTVETAMPDARARNISAVLDGARGMNVILSIDRAAPVRTDIPAVLLSLTLPIYPDECAAAFEENWDEIVYPSAFAARRAEPWRSHFVHMKAPPGVHVAPLALDPAFERTLDRTWLDRWTGLEGRRFILFPHRPEAEKGHAEALEVLEHLIARDDRFHLLVPRSPRGRRFDAVPESAFLGDLAAAVRDKRLEAHVTFHDWVPRSRRPDYFAGGDCCLHLSRHLETFGLTAIEALAAGTRVFSRGAGALRETVPPDLGHIVMPDGSSREFAEAILSHADAAAVERGRVFVRTRYAADRFVGQILEILRAARRSDRTVSLQ